MVKRYWNLLRSRVTSDSFDLKLGQTVAYLITTLLLVLGFMKLTRLDLNETELFFGLLLLIVAMLLTTCLGTLHQVLLALKHIRAAADQRLASGGKTPGSTG